MKRLFFLFSLSSACLLLADEAPSTEAVFTRIWKECLWGKTKDGKPSSGTGSLIENAEPYVHTLQEFLDHHNIKTVIELHSGNWSLSEYIDWGKRKYTGLDFVQELIDENNERFKTKNIRFQHIHSLDDELPPGDLLICKDLLQHMSNKEIISFLKKVKKYKYCLFTNDIRGYPHANERALNKDVPTGSTRPLDLLAPPFNLQAARILTYYAKDSIKQIVLVDNTKTPPSTFTKVPLPHELQGIPKGEDEGIVLEAKRIMLPDAPHAYNPTIIPYEDGYLLGVRSQDAPLPPTVNPTQRKEQIGIVKLDKEFRPLEKVTFLNREEDTFEDPRLFIWNDKIHVSHNIFHVYPERNTFDFRIALGTIDPKEKKLISDVMLDYHPDQREKNWTPFVHKTEGREDLYYVYTFLPHKVVQVAPSLDGKILHPFESTEHLEQFKFWEYLWGTIHGGTQAILVDDEYLSFFHSAFYADGKRWYVLGAITFEKDPPFRLKKISKYPILFQNIYESPTESSVWFYPRDDYRVVFSGGFVEAKKKGKEVFHLVLGENDSVIKLLTLDKKKLMNSLLDFSDLSRTSLLSQKQLHTLQPLTLPKAFLDAFPKDSYEVQRVLPIGSFYGNDNNPKQEILSYIKKYTRLSSKAIDIGAKSGLYSVAMGESVGKDGIVLSFEVSKNRFRELIWNIQLNRKTNIIPSWAAISNLSKKMPLSSFPVSDEEKNPNEYIPSITLDSLHLANVSFLRINAEGFEENVLHGSMTTIKENRPIILISFPQKTGKAKIKETLQLLLNVHYFVQPINESDFLVVPAEQAYAT